MFHPKSRSVSCIYAGVDPLIIVFCLVIINLRIMTTEGYVNEILKGMSEVGENPRRNRVDKGMINVQV